MTQGTFEQSFKNRVYEHENQCCPLAGENFNADSWTALQCEQLSKFDLKMSRAWLKTHSAPNQKLHDVALQFSKLLKYIKIKIKICIKIFSHICLQACHTHWCYKCTQVKTGQTSEHQRHNIAEETAAEFCFRTADIKGILLDYLRDCGALYPWLCVHLCFQ